MVSLGHKRGRFPTQTNLQRLTRVSHIDEIKTVVSLQSEHQSPVPFDESIRGSKIESIDGKKNVWVRTFSRALSERVA